MSKITETTKDKTRESTYMIGDVVGVYGYETDVIITDVRKEGSSYAYKVYLADEEEWIYDDDIAYRADLRKTISTLKYNPQSVNKEITSGYINIENNAMYHYNDIVFVKNIGWVRITNSYWDSLANEYIYEAIGFNGKGEYEHINQSNIVCQMPPESENPHTCGNKITLDEYKNNDKEWLFNKLAMLDNITALESIQDIFNYLQQFKYPKTYEECCKVMGINHTNDLDICEHCDYKTEITYYEDSLLEKIEALYRLRICRDAYWKIAGEEIGLGKSWEPDWNNPHTTKWTIVTGEKVRIVRGNTRSYHSTFAFPTEEMRDAFYENFKKEIEICKELL